MLKIDFLIVGAQKAATTSLRYYLDMHPEIYMQRLKECKFFILEEHYKKGYKYLISNWFPDLNSISNCIIGLVDPDIMFFEEALERLRNYIDFSSAKFIFILRDPVERAFSHYLMTYRRGLEKLTFEEAIEKENERLSKGGFFEKMHYSYVSRGFYLKQIERFLPYVKRSQMLFLLTEELKQDRINTLKKIFNFLNVSIDFVPPNINVQYHKATVPKSVTLLRLMKSNHKAKKIITRLLIPSSKIRHFFYDLIYKFNQTDRININMTEKARLKLAKLYKDENKRLSDFLRIDLSLWWNSMNIV